MDDAKTNSGFWRANLRVIVVLLSIWFAAGYGSSIFGIEGLNRFRMGKLELGFWFAQQGSIFVFVLIVLAYALWMDRIDRLYGVEDDR